MITKLRPKCYPQRLSLPVVGPILEDFTRWSQSRGYSIRTIRNQIDDMRLIDAYLQLSGAQCLEDLTNGSLETAWHHYRHLRPRVAGTIHQIQRFLIEIHVLQPQPAPSKTAQNSALALFIDHLRKVRGLEESTIRGHIGCLRRFMEFIGYDEKREVWERLTPGSLDDFVQVCAKRLNRPTLQHAVGYLRAFLRFQHEQGILHSPLHTMIEGPRIYYLERLPRHLPWETVRQLLFSIDRTNPHGLRDYTMLFLVATYGLRSCEVISLTLDDIDWRTGTIRIPQRKTASQLLLPLTDGAGNVIYEYLKQSRPEGPYRQLFLRVRAPFGLLKRTALPELFQLRVRLSGLNLPRYGPHCLRHSYAVHLLCQGTSVKVIGDLLGHRNTESTYAYLRLAAEDLRTVALPIPRGNGSESATPQGPIKNSSRARGQGKPVKGKSPTSSTGFLSTEVENYLQLKRSLGLTYSYEADILRNLDAFVATYYPSCQDLTPEIFNHWSAILEHLPPRSQRRHMLLVRSFCLYRKKSNPDTFVPDQFFFPVGQGGFKPHILPESDIARLLAATEYLMPCGSSPLRPQTLHMAIVLLYCGGLRRGELLRLTLGDFNASEATLLVRGTKFKKSRIIPLSPSVAQALAVYLAVRDKSGFPMGASSPLIWNRHGSTQGRGYTGTGLRCNWSVLCKALGILTDKGRPPRIHDLRHSFAVNVLQRCYLAGEDAQAKLPLLSTYMGHISIAYTHHYLSSVEMVRSAASKLFHGKFGSLLTTGFSDPGREDGGAK